MCCCCCSVCKLCLTLCNPMNCTTPGFPVLHCLLELAQTHVHWIGDAIQPSHPLSLSSPPALNLSQHRSFPMSWLFTAGGQSIGASASVLPMNSQNCFLLGMTGLISKRYNFFFTKSHIDTPESLLHLPPLYFSGTYKLYNFLFFFLFWSIFDEQFCISFKCTAKWYSYTYTCILFQMLFPFWLLKLYNFLCMPWQGKDSKALF